MSQSILIFIFKPLKMYKLFLACRLQKQAEGRIWPLGHSVLTPGIEDRLLLKLGLQIKIPRDPVLSKIRV